VTGDAEGEVTHEPCVVLQHSNSKKADMLIDHRLIDASVGPLDPPRETV
jgi:hypothetical protein